MPSRGAVLIEEAIINGAKFVKCEKGVFSHILYAPYFEEIQEKPNSDPNKLPICILKLKEDVKETLLNKSKNFLGLK